MEIHFDEKKCEGHAQCAFNGPDFYPLNDDGHCTISPVTKVFRGFEEQAADGAMACPEQALTVIQ